jgi:hypothetical protein
MKNTDKDKIREPFPPEQTPNPPQIVDPNLKNERGERSAPANNNQENNKPAEKEENQKIKDTGKRLGDPTEIDDETTI